MCCSINNVATATPFFLSWSQGAREPGSQGAREPGSQGAREPGSQGAREPGSQGAREPGSNNLTKLCIIKEFRGYYWRSYKG